MPICVSGLATAARSSVSNAPSQRLIVVVLTLHPDGIPHGPHPGTIMASRPLTRTDELAVMVDTVRPLALTRQALEMDDPAYPYSWLE